MDFNSPTEWNYSSTIEASDLKEFRLNGRAELHNVSIVLYGRDSSRFDQIYGGYLAYDQKTGYVTANGDEQIDLVANPAGLASPDQSTPKELKNPIHLKTRDLVFKRKPETPRPTRGSNFKCGKPRAAVGVKYASKSNTLTLSSQIHVTLSGANAAVIEAEHGIITNEPREIVLDHPRLERDGGMLRADQAVFQLGPSHVERVLATGNVQTETRAGRHSIAGAEQPSEIRGQADQAEFLLTGKQDLLLDGNPEWERSS